MLTACVAEPMQAPFPSSTASVEGETSTRSQPELRTLASVDIPDLETVTDGDNGSLVYTVIPQIAGYDVFNERLRAIVRSAQEHLAGPHSAHVPRRGSVNVSWQALGTGEDIV